MFNRELLRRLSSRLNQVGLVLGFSMAGEALVSTLMFHDYNLTGIEAGLAIMVISGANILSDLSRE